MRRSKKNTVKKEDTFIIDESPCELKAEDKKLIANSQDAMAEEDLTNVLAKLLKVVPKTEPQAVYRIQHQKASDIEELLVSLLPVLDSFENLLGLAEQFAEEEVVQNWMKSMEAIYKKLKIVLSKQGLQPIESLGTLVDFTVHEVVEYRNIVDGIPNLIIEEKQKGYRYKGKTIREARVVVANAEGGK